MKEAAKFAIALVTAPSLKVARQLAAAALHARVVACANLIPGVESHYWWRDKMERSAETLILFKTTRRCLNALEKLVMAAHPYDTPEFLVLEPTRGAKRYLRWLKANARGPAKKAPARRAARSVKQIKSL